MTPKRVFMAMLAALILVIFAGGFLFYSIDGSLVERAQRVNSLKADADILDLKIANSKFAAAELDKYQDIELILEDVLPPEKIQNDVLAEILSFAEANNAAIESINFPSTDGTSLDFSTSQTEPVEGVPGVLSVPVSLSVVATFENMLSMLDDFEDNQRKMQVSSVRITPINDEAGNPTGNFTINLTINVFQRA